MIDNTRSRAKSKQSNAQILHLLTVAAVDFYQFHNRQRENPQRPAAAAM